MIDWEANIQRSILTFVETAAQSAYPGVLVQAQGTSEAAKGANRFYDVTPLSSNEDQWEENSRTATGLFVVSAVCKKAEFAELSIFEPAKMMGAIRKALAAARNLIAVYDWSAETPVLYGSLLCSIRRSSHGGTYHDGDSTNAGVIYQGMTQAGRHLHWQKLFVRFTTTLPAALAA